MSETLLAVVITGAVTILATSLGQVLSGRSSRRIASEERRLRVAQELRPLAMKAVAAVGAAAEASQAEHDALGELFGVPPTERDWRAFEPTKPVSAVADAARDSAHAALVELELSISDREASRVVADVAEALRMVKRTTIDFSIELSNPDAAMVGQDAWHALTQLEATIRTLVQALQPLTTLERPTRRRRRWAQALGAAGTRKAQLQAKRDALHTARLERAKTRNGRV